MKSLKEQINESIIGGIIFTIAAVALAGGGAAFVEDLKYTIMRNMDKKRYVRDFEKKFSKEELIEITDEIRQNPTLRNWKTWNDFVTMMNTEQKFQNITNKAREL